MAPAVRRDVVRNREAILSAAVELLARTPAASMAAIAEASGTGRTTLYRHFPDRDHLIGALYDRVLREATDLVDARLGADRDPAPGTLAELAVELSRFGARYRFLDGQAPDRDRAARDTRSATLEAWVAEGQRRGALRADLSPAWVGDVVGALCSAAATGGATADRSRELRASVVALVRPDPRDPDGRPTHPAG